MGSTFPLLTWLPPINSPLLDQPLSCGKKIHLIKEEIYKIITTGGISKTSDPAPIPKELREQPEQIVSYLEKCVFSANRGFTTTLGTTYPTTETTKDRKVELRCEGEKLVWFLSDKVKKTVSWLYLSEEDTITLKAIPEKERPFLFENFRVKFLTRNGRIRKVEFKKLSCRLVTWLPPINSPFLDQPLSCGKKIHLIKEENYKIITTDGISKTSKPAPIPKELEEQPEQIVVSYLEKCVFSTNRGFTTTLGTTYPTTETTKDRKIELRCEGETLIWFLSDKVKKTVSWLYLSEEDTITLKAIPENERRFLFEDFRVKFLTRNGRIRKVEFEKLSHRSQLNPRERIDRDLGAVTLISHGSSCEESDTGCGHAQIIFETFRRGEYCSYLAHITARGVTQKNRAMVKIRPIYSKLEFRKKSPTWRRPHNLIEQAITQIQNGQLVNFQLEGPLLEPIGLSCLLTIVLAVAHPPSSIFRLLFLQAIPSAIAGPILAQGIAEMAGDSLSYNCLVWAVNKIRKIGIPLPQTDIIPIPDRYIDSLWNYTGSINLSR